MFKKLALASLLALWSSIAWAQNPTCPTRAVGDSTNACASTAFVQNQITPFFITCPAHQWVTSIAAGLSVCSQPAFSDISGAATNAQLPQMAADTVKCNSTGSTGTSQDCTMGQGLNFLTSTTVQLERGYVHIWPHSTQTSGATNAWQAIDPYGNPINCTSTQTQCYQEAYNAASTNGWGLICDGAGSSGNPGTITLGTTLQLTRWRDGFIDNRNCNITSNGSLGTADVVQIRSMENSYINFDAVISQNPSDTGVVVRIGSDATPTVSWDATYLHIADIVPGASTSGPAVVFDTTNQGIQGNHFWFDDINGGTYAVSCTGLASHVMYGNDIHGMDWHSQGTGTTNCGPTVGGEHDNSWLVALSRPANVTTAWNVYGVGDYIRTFVSTELGTITNGILFNTNSCANVVVATFNNPTNFITDTTGCNDWVRNTSNTYVGLTRTINGPLNVKLGGSTSTFQPAGSVCRNTTSTGTGADTTEDTLQSCSLPASSLVTTGQRVHIKAYGTFGADGNNKTIKAYFGAQIYNSGTLTQNGTGWTYEGEVWRTGSNAQTYSGPGLQASTSIVGVNFGTLTQTETGAITIKITGQNGTAVANDIVCSAMFVDMIN